MKKTTTRFIIAIILIILITGVVYKITENNMNSENTKILLETNLGEITLELYSNEVMLFPVTLRLSINSFLFSGIVIAMVINLFDFLWKAIISFKLIL